MYISKPAYENALLNLKECKDHKVKLDTYPLKIYIEPTTLCNLRCEYCSPTTERVNEEFDMNLFYEIEKQLFDKLCEVNLFLRGEPTLAKCFPEMLKICSKYPFITKFFTNLSYNNDNILKLIVEAGAFINISVDSFTQAEQIRKGSSIDLVLKNIDLLQKYQEKIKNPKFHMRQAIVVSKRNIGELLDIINKSYQLGFKEIMLGCLDNYYFRRINMLTEEDADVFEEAVKLADKLKLRISTPSHIGGKKLSKVSNWEDFELPIDKYFPHFIEDSNPDVEKKFCSYPWIQTVFEYNGEVNSCCQRKIRLGKFEIGMDFIKDIWNNENYQNLRSFKDFRYCKKLLDYRIDCGLLEYSIWGGEKRLDKV